ncbi:DUF1569 domain-containing protein [Streptomyces turgidiscabies]|uniref:DinB-like domain-containing protein n=1 Tax=Streptomyces turgidiscabies (strain Car8) TaxID=698760 RepID=L7F6X4_STRT8|nr:MULTISPECIES: DUF1569 domain-containing protein [Streptomyces]ELP66864.1 hypothetical protein STRTUCAR8_09672 [Streptomyces turgidiscabies Car8]MDX3491968.1 DUF1569 domain-containing protein [Streptomyces turgidiscabies]GAQ71915.1 hypothetical protein T45_03660 [Streptomyces turgidiscabies]
MTTPTLTELTERLHSDLGRPAPDLLAPGGPWNLSQTLQHCAQTVRYSVTGYPRLRPALFRATAGALAKRIFLRRGATKHSLGAEIDGAPALDPNLPVTEAASGLADAVALFTGHTGPHAPHPAYGRCTHDEFAQLHAMHLAEHLPGLVDA